MSSTTSPLVVSSTFTASVVTQTSTAALSTEFPTTFESTTSESIPDLCDLSCYCLYGCNKNEEECPLMSDCPYKCSCNNGTFKMSGRCAFLATSDLCYPPYNTAEPTGGSRDVLRNYSRKENTSARRDHPHVTKQATARTPLSFCEIDTIWYHIHDIIALLFVLFDLVLV